MICIICNTNHRDCQDHPYTDRETTRKIVNQLQWLSEVKGIVSISDGIATLPDGSTINLMAR